MKRSARLTDFLLVTVAVTTILLSLWPLAAKQQSPKLATTIETTTESSHAPPVVATKPATVDPETVDPAKAVANWQNEVADFYAQRDSMKTAEPSESAIQTVSYNAPPAIKSKQPAKRKSTRTSAQPLPKARFGLVLQDRHVSMTFIFAICGGVLLGLGYLEWARQSPEVVAAAIEFHDADDDVTSVAFDPKWGVAEQSKAVVARRVTLAGVVIWALLSVVL
ncbi:MAG: hypothetical protein WBD20_04515 [Pirellulaceae bacterium]